MSASPGSAIIPVLADFSKFDADVAARRQQAPITIPIAGATPVSGAIAPTAPVTFGTGGGFAQYSPNGTFAALTPGSMNFGGPTWAMGGASGSASAQVNAGMASSAAQLSQAASALIAAASSLRTGGGGGVGFSGGGGADAGGDGFGSGGGPGGSGMAGGGGGRNRIFGLSAQGLVRYVSAGFVLREALHVAQEQRAIGIESALAGNDPFAQLQAAQSQVRALSGIPVVGQAAEFLSDPSGSFALGNAALSQSAQLGISYSEKVYARQREVLHNQQEAAVGGYTPGIQRRGAEIELAYQRRTESIREQRKTAAQDPELVKQRAADEALAQSRYAEAVEGSKFAGAGAAPNTDLLQKASAQLDRDMKAAADADRKRRQQIDDQARKDEEAARQSRDNQYRDINLSQGEQVDAYRVQGLRAAIGAQPVITAADRASSFYASAYAQKDKIDREQGFGEGSAFIRAQDAIFGGQEREIARMNAANRSYTLGSGQASILRASGRGFEAGSLDAVIDLREQLSREKDPERREDLYAKYGFSLASSAISATRSAADITHSFRAESDIAHDTLNRDPRQAIRDEINARTYESRKAIMMLPAFAQGPLNALLDKTTDTQIRAAQQGINDSVFNERFRLNADTGRLNILGNSSLDPAVRENRAKLFGVLTSAESSIISARQRGRGENNGRDNLVPDIQENFSATIRGLQVERLNGLQAEELDPNRTATNGPGTEDLAQVMADIHSQLKNLNDFIQSTLK